MQSTCEHYLYSLLWYKQYLQPLKPHEYHRFMEVCGAKDAKYTLAAVHEKGRPTRFAILRDLVSMNPLNGFFLFLDEIRRHL